MSNLFKLNSADFVRGAITAVFTAVVATVFSATQQPEFNILSIDWVSVLNAAFYGFIGYIGKNLATDSNGAVFGKFGASKR